MDERKLRIIRPAVVTLPEKDIQALLDAGNGDAALVYLHTLLHGELDAAQAATDLHRSDGDIRAAVERLHQMGVLSSGDREPIPEDHDRFPEYRAEDVVRRSTESPEFQELVKDIQNTLGRTLTTADLKKLFGIYDDLSLPRDVILMLVNYCKLEHDAVCGPEKSLGFAVIEKEAFVWFHREIMTFEQAEEWVAELDRRKSQTARFMAAAGFPGRRPSPTEKKYIDGWLELGFDVDALSVAADRTVTNTGGLKWKYMNSIVLSWHEKGLHTVAEIEKGDKKPEKKAARSGKPATGFSPITRPTRDDAKTLEQLRRIQEKMKNG